MEKEYYALNDQYIQLKNIYNSNYKCVATLQQGQSDDKHRNNNTSNEVTLGSKKIPDTRQVINPKRISKLCGEVNYTKLVQDRIKSFHFALNNINNCKIRSEEKDAFLNNLN